VRTRQKRGEFAGAARGTADIGKRVVGRQASKEGRPLTKFVRHSIMFEIDMLPRFQSLAAGNPKTFIPLRSVCNSFLLSLSLSALWVNSNPKSSKISLPDKSL
jgi:hypothetical protein